MNILTTLLAASPGTARIAGQDVGTRAGQVRRLIGYLPENVKFYENLTLEENLLFFARLSGVPDPGPESAPCWRPWTLPATAGSGWPPSARAWGVLWACGALNVTTTLASVRKWSLSIEKHT